MPYRNELIVKKVKDLAHLPTTNYKLDAGVDLYTCGNYLLPPESVINVSTGIAMFVPNGMYGSIRERGSITRYPPISIGAGVIDEGYSGEVVLVIKNPLNTSVYLPHHTKIAQVVFSPYVQITKVREVEALPEKNSDRKENGGIHIVYSEGKFYEAE